MGNGRNECSCKWGIRRKGYPGDEKIVVSPMTIAYGCWNSSAAGGVEYAATKQH